MSLPTSPTRADAVRFLQMASFGGRPVDVTNVQTNGIPAWIDQQLAAAPSIPFVDRYIRHRRTDTGSSLQRSVWEAFLTAPDQLRQRVAYALAQIFVVSDVDLEQRDVAEFAERIEANCFGTYRNLLEVITRSRAMGYYLTYHRNQREDLNRGRFPDENYAREIMQLFSIGLWQLNPDGTPRGGPDMANWIPTYTQDDILGLSRVFTGFEARRVDDDSNAAQLRQSMESDGDFAERWHETGEKRFLGVTIPAQEGRTLDEDIAVALDTIAAHPNVPPFISKLLIQRLVKSNPTPGYIRRVADRFIATSGDLGEVVRAILIDDEAWVVNPGPNYFGKLREPVLRFTTICRGFNIELDSREAVWPFTSLSDAQDELGQQPWEAPTVFNFYLPAYVPPQTPLGDAGLTAPEFQIANESSAIGWINFMSRTLREPSRGNANGQRYDRTVLDIADLASLMTGPAPTAGNSGSVVDDIAARLCPRGISPQLRSLVVERCRTLTHRDYENTGNTGARVRPEVDRDRVVLAVMMIAASTDFLHEY